MSKSQVTNVSGFALHQCNGEKVGYAVQKKTTLTAHAWTACAQNTGEERWENTRKSQ